MSMKVEVLGLDLATSSGYAHSSESGVWDLSPDTSAPTKGQVAEPEWARCGKLMARLDQLCCDLHGKRVIVFCEGATGFTRFPHTNKIGHELRGIVKAYCYQQEWRYHEVVPTSLKKWATGNGKASKDDMVEAASKFNPEVESHDEADAILLRQFGLDQLAQD